MEHVHREGLVRWRNGKFLGRQKRARVRSNRAAVRLLNFILSILEAIGWSHAGEYFKRPTWLLCRMDCGRKQDTSQVATVVAQTGGDGVLG